MKQRILGSGKERKDIDARIGFHPPDRAGHAGLSGNGAAPAHLFAHQPTLDALPAAQFVGPALVVDCSDAAAGAVLTMERLAPVRQLADRAAFLLIRTGWDRFWGTPDYYGDYPVIGPDVVEYLIGSGKQGIGLDTIGVDAIYNETLPIHQKLLGTGRMVVIENLTGLDRAGGGLFTFCALPLHFCDADGAPVRAVGLLGGPQTP